MNRKHIPRRSGPATPLITAMPDVRMKMLIADGEQAVIPISFTGTDAATRFQARVQAAVRGRLSAGD